MIAALITEAQTDPAFARQYRARFVEPRRDQARAIFRRAIDRGEIPADTDADVVLDLLFGSAYHRLLQGHRPLTDPVGTRPWVVSAPCPAGTSRRAPSGASQC